MLPKRQIDARKAVKRGKFGGEAAVANALRTTRSIFDARFVCLAFPEKFRRATDFRWKAFVHGTIECRLLKDFPVRMIGPERDVNF
jgi:hypothetical protein